MWGRSPLTVRINDGMNDRHVTDYMTDLKFRKVANGGHHSASCTLLVPRRTFTDLGPADKVYIYDGRTAQTIWEGYTQNPGDIDGDTGQGFDLSALGGMTRVSDERRALIYVDTDYQLWARAPLTSVPASARTEVTTDPTGVLGDGLICQFIPGSTIATGAGAQIDYSFTQTDMEFGALAVTYKSGKADAGYDVKLATSGGASPSDSFILTSGMLTSTSTANRWVGETGHPLAGRKHVAFAINRTGGATSVADDNTWSFFTALSMLGRRMDRYGVLVTGVTGMISNIYTRADWVVEDLLGRLLTMCDPDTATIDATTAQIDQLAYHESVSAATVLDDLELHEPDFLWEVLETGANGLHRFNYRAWPTTTARYEISTGDGYSAPGGDTDLCNRIAVNWTDAKGVPQVTIRTSTVAALDDAGIVRDADPVTLPQGRGSLANATRIGDQILTSLASPAKAATAVVQRPLMDCQTGRLVMPWEIQAGYLVRVRETDDLLRLTELEYADADRSSTLTLGTPVLSLEQRVARLARVK